jgi:hypothetical protein
LGVSWPNTSCCSAKTWQPALNSPAASAGLYVHGRICLIDRPIRHSLLLLLVLLLLHHLLLLLLLLLQEVPQQRPRPR